MTDRLCVVMPVYNEEAAIGGVLKKWSEALTALGVDFTIRPYNDGSKDSSLKVMRDFVASNPSSRIEVKDKLNGGHGNTILTGYREAVADGFDWIFQIDSDDEMGPERFGELWGHRGEHDFLIGIRDGRKQALSRKLISFVSRLCVRLFYGKSIWDVNTPYRLMRVSAFKDFFSRIPFTTFAPNVILSGLAARYGLKSFQMRVPQHDRTTGEVSIQKWKLFRAAVKSFSQTFLFALKTARSRDWGRYIFWGGLFSLTVVSVAVGFKNGLRFIDFQWVPAKVMMLGENPYQYSLQHLHHDGCVVAANQLPSCLLLLAPFTFLTRMVANQAWTCFNLVFTFVFFWYLYQVWFRGRLPLFSLVVLLTLIGTPWRVLIGNGQHLMFSLAFFMAAYYYTERGRWGVGGLFLALSAFKYTTIVPMAFIFLAMRWWRPILIAIWIHFMMTIGCAIYLHESPLTLVLQSLQVGGSLTAAGDADIASLMGWFGFENVKTWAIIGYVVYTVLLFALSFRKTKDQFLLLSILAVISNVMFYHRVYDFVTLVFPFALILRVPRSRWLVSMTIVNLAWFFYLNRVVGVLHVHMGSMLVSFVLMHVLLVVLLSHIFRTKTAVE